MRGSDLFKVLPGPFVVFLGWWFSLFDATSLAHPDWRLLANSTSLALAAVTSLVIVLYRRKAESTLTVWATVALLVFLALAVACNHYYDLLEAPQPRGQVEAYKSRWRSAYIGMMVALSICVSFAACALTRPKPHASLLSEFVGGLKAIWGWIQSRRAKRPPAGDKS